MQKSWLLVSMLCSALILAFFTPVFAAEKLVEIKYQFAGMIFDERNNMTGTFALTLSGRFRETAPDMQAESSGGYTYGPVEYTDSRTENFTMNETLYRIDYFVHYYEFSSESYHSYIEKWYAQASYNGKLSIIWADGSTSSSTVNLNPIEIAKFVYNSAFIHEYLDEFRSTMYRWENKTSEWILVDEKSGRSGLTESGALSREGFGIAFTGDIKGKDGRRNGLLILEDDEITESASGIRYWDNNQEPFEYTRTYHEFIAMGKFGPYLLSALRTV